MTADGITAGSVTKKPVAAAGMRRDPVREDGSRLLRKEEICCWHTDWYG